jgi:hypothetical protein
MTKFARCASTIFLACMFVACSNTPPVANNPSPSPSISNNNGGGGGGDGVATFVIKEPASGSEVTSNNITVEGVGAKPGDSIEVSVLTDRWYKQDGKADIKSDGSWSYSPCYLMGKGPLRLKHIIKASVVRDGKQITSTVNEIRAPEPTQ